MTQNFKYEYEIIIINDCSTDKTKNLLKTFVSSFKVKNIYNSNCKQIKLINLKENSGPAIARNTGAKNAQGKVIVYTDDDCIPNTDWLQQMILPFSDNDIIAVKGAYKTNQNSIVAKFVQIEYEYKYEILKNYHYIDTIDTYSAAFRKDVFLKEEGFDESFPVACAEDFEFSYRLSLKGYKMVFNPNAIVYHRHPDRLLWYLKKKYKFAYWRWLAIKKNPEKLTHDTHTPSDMKLLAIISPILLLSSIYSIHKKKFFCAVPFILFFLSSFKFVKFIFKKNPLIGIFSLALIFLRGISQFAGILLGLKNLTSYN